MMKKLCDHPLYRYLNEQDISKIECARHSHSYLPQELIISAGERTRDILCIDEGEVLVYIESEDGKPLEITRLPAGSLIGEMNFVMPTHRTAFVMAMGEVKVSSYRYHELTRILSKDYDLAGKLFAALNLQMTSKLLALLG
ncbi:MAG: cyclic nucleotide-binding domain-containing protein [Candidatus Cloacimonetes bacterium]|jgi:CRP-like cAMP-binding protein|nr:cyclic nucleotide-binding domain-containing protein [Candidatus Cloacimonadota bacterium]MDD3097859.1 cyclic nucleotide-binding domain-containing protein [Candidatus Cloacimonadota bacterium]MDD3578353.1 cyclic nucleotide-binding domain-containing protein [Candidatus Cloacimonadota bacterium]